MVTYTWRSNGRGYHEIHNPSLPAGESLSGLVWQWQEFQSSDDTVVKPENPEAYTLEFLADGTLAVGADCNRATGTYTVDGSLLILEVTAMTMAPARRARWPPSLSNT